MKQFSVGSGKIKSSAGKRASRRSSDEWQKIYKNWLVSGQTLAEFATSQGLSYSTLNKWVGHFRREESQSADLPAFVNIAKPAVQIWDFELDLGQGIVLRMRKS